MTSSEALPTHFKEFNFFVRQNHHNLTQDCPNNILTYLHFGRPLSSMQHVPPYMHLHAGGIVGGDSIAAKFKRHICVIKTSSTKEILPQRILFIYLYRTCVCNLTGYFSKALLLIAHAFVALIFLPNYLILIKVKPVAREL